jgi:hypothetical protein
VFYGTWIEANGYIRNDQVTSEYPNLKKFLDFNDFSAEVERPTFDEVGMLRSKQVGSHQETDGKMMKYIVLSVCVIRLLVLSGGAFATRMDASVYLVSHFSDVLISVVVLVAYFRIADGRRLLLLYVALLCFELLTLFADVSGLHGLAHRGIQIEVLSEDAQYIWQGLLVNRLPQVLLFWIPVLVAAAMRKQSSRIVETDHE